MTLLIRALFSVAAAVLAANASAASIYRCGQEYTQLPCAEGRVVLANDTVTPEQRAEARQVALSERRLAEQMARDRRADEAAIHPARATSLGPSKPKADTKAAATKTRRKAKKRAAPESDDDFIAHVPKVKVARN